MNAPTDATARPPRGWRSRAHEIIYEADTPAGKTFDVVLMILIVTSVAGAMLGTVESVAARYGPALRVFEWVVTLLFTIEYVLRLVCVLRPLRYATSFFGVIDLLAVLPTYLFLITPGRSDLIVIRLLRMLRMFRVLKLARYVTAANQLRTALRLSRPKIAVFLYVVVVAVIIIGALMYNIEGGENGFDSIPRSVYWAVVTMTTVGYGDISPQTPLGQALASVVMILGYGIIAVPTGIVTVEYGKVTRAEISTQACPSCSLEGHSFDAEYCKYCGAKL